jgi:hypothetical protein
MTCYKCEDTGWIKSRTVTVDGNEYDKYKPCDCQKPKQEQLTQKESNKKQWWRDAN